MKDNCPFNWASDREIARHNPQIVVDWMVEEGLLEPHFSGVCYAVVQPEPHKHEWFVRRGAKDGEVVPLNLIVMCACGQESSVPNRLPVEVPE